MFTALACRSDFSVGESILDVDRLIEIAKEKGQSAVALTDTMSVTAMIDFSTKAKKAGLKPIIGARLRISEDPLWRPAKGEKKKHMPPAWFVTLYVRSQNGLKALFRLLSLANDEDHFYYTSKLGWDDLVGELNKLHDTEDYALVLGDEQGIYQSAQLPQILTEIENCDLNVYLPIVAIDTPYYGRINAKSIDIHKDKGWPLLAIRPALYGEDEADFQEVMAGVADNTKISDGWFRSRFTRDLHMMDLASFVAQAKACGQHLVTRGYPDAGALIIDALKQTKPFVDAVSYEWEKQPPCLPKLATNEFETVKAECAKGWTERFSKMNFGHTPDQKTLMDTYLPRLKYELSILDKLDFSGYFLLVQDIVRYAKSNGILVGPGRGSVGGSLVAYLMGITDCDPIRFGLLFERFINPERLDLPDADLDFMSERRHEIVDYLVGKFGQKRVAGVSNFGTLGTASAIRDVGRITGIPEKEFSVSKFVPKKHGQNLSLEESRENVTEIDAFAKKYAHHWQIMNRLEGKVKNFSQHAAGIVVGGCDIEELAVVEKRKDNFVVNWDKRVIEDQGLVKIDLLGLNTLDVIALAQQYIEELHGTPVDLGAIPLDDPQVLENFGLGRTLGVFQFESGGMRNLLKNIAAGGQITFEDISAATALYRPGPMESGMMESFYKRKQGIEPIEYDHPLIEPILDETFGVIVYQEQVMKISQVIAGYTGAQADKLRKIMGKKLPEEMRKERGKFVQGCVDTIACSEQWAGELFDKIEGFAGYGFNKSHSVEYTLISYQCMYLKTHHPLAFYAAALSLFDSDKLLPLMRDAATHGVVVRMPDINRSSKRFEIIKGSSDLVIPFQRIMRVSEKTADAILEARAAGPFTSKQDFLDRVEKRKCNIRVQEALDKVGAFAMIEREQLSPNNPARIKDQIELLPGLISAYVPINRDMNRNNHIRSCINDTVDEYRAKHGPDGDGDGMPVKPHFGRAARVMIISDAPGSEEERSGVMGMSRSNLAVVEAMDEVGLTMQDVYWTALIKRPKRERQVTADEISIYKPYLDDEIKVLEPTVIVLLGSQVTRTMIPNFKGKASDAAGSVIYFKELDANVVVGFSPGEIYHAPEKQENMNKVFASVAELLS